ATRQGILDAIRFHLMDKVKRGDSAIFHFSGHGQQVHDQNGDEVDGYDEAIVPYDSPLEFQPGVYEGENLIRDEELGALLKSVRAKLGKNGRLLTLIDACHSGTATRGLAKARGTNVRMASREFIAAHSGKTEEDNALAAEVPDVDGLAPMVAFFSASPQQASYEQTDENGNTYGALSLTFGQAFANLEPGATYRVLFDQIRLGISALSPRQTAQAEGLLDEEVLGGNIAGAPRYFLPIEKIDQNTFRLNAGTLAGLHDRSVVAFFPIGTYDTVGVKPLALATIANATLLDCDAELDRALPKKDNACWVFIREQNYGSLSASLRLELPPGDLLTALQNLSAECPAIHLVETNPELVLQENSGTDKLFLLAKDGFALDSFDLPANGNFKGLLRSVRADAIAFAQAKFLRSLEIEDARLGIALEFLTPGGERFAFEEKQDFRVGEEVRLRVRNAGSEACFFSVLDLPPNNLPGMLIPWDKPAVDYFLPPGAHFDFPEIITITEPAGTDVLKLIASEQPLDLSDIVKTRAAEGGGSHPLEVLLRETYLLDRRRGGETSNVPGGGVAVGSVVVEIRE
ncbi:MAG: caspase family protein, partial [Bacteroidota bacterium]